MAQKVVEGISDEKEETNGATKEDVIASEENRGASN